MSKLLNRFGNPVTDEYCTPPWLTAMLPLVDLDPASNPRSTVKAKRTYSLEKRLDGRVLPWTGSVLLNFPYSDPLPWCVKLIEELTCGRCTEAIVICKLDSSVTWWHTLVGYGSPELWLFDRRVMFDEPAELVAARIAKHALIAKPRKREPKRPPGEKSTTNFSSAIIHHRGSAPQLDLASVASRWVTA